MNLSRLSRLILLNVYRLPDAEMRDMELLSPAPVKREQENVDPSSSSRPSHIDCPDKTFRRGRYTNCIEPFCKPAVRNLQHGDTEKVLMVPLNTMGVTSAQSGENTRRQLSAATSTLSRVETAWTQGLEATSPLGSIVASVTT